MNGSWGCTFPSLTLSSYPQWKVLSPDGQLMGMYSGDSATIVIRNNGCQVSRNSAVGPALEGGVPPEDGRLAAEEGWGWYRRRGSTLGMDIWVRIRNQWIDFPTMLKTVTLVSCILSPPTTAPIASGLRLR